MRKPLKVLKIGGKVTDDYSKLNLFLNNFARIDEPKILIHGGGVIASEIGKKLGIKPRFIEGRRVTDKQTLDLVTMVYGGLVNKKLVAAMQAIGIPALGLTGADMNVILAEKRKAFPIDFGMVGDIKSIDKQALNLLVEKKIVPVLAPLTHDGAGSLLNTNADAIASHTAAALSEDFAVELILCFEQPGVLYAEKVIPSIYPSSYKKLKEDGVVTEGMIPKLDLGFEALKNGVKSVRIARFDDFLNPEKGTVLVNE